MQSVERKKMLRQKSRNALLSAFDWLQVLVVALAAVTLLLAFAVRVVGVYGDSMVPTLSHGDRLLLSTVDTTYGRGDIVVVDRYTDEPLIKRVVAVAGDKVEITEEHQLYINGVLQDEPYTNGITLQRDLTEPVTVPEGYVFVLGDNRTWSKDSRQKEIGLVSVKDIVGKAIYRVWPLDDIGGVYD